MLIPLGRDPVKMRLSSLMLGALISLSGWLQVFAQSSGVFKSEKASFKVVTIAFGLEHPWSMAFLPDGDLLCLD